MGHPVISRCLIIIILFFQIGAFSVLAVGIWTIVDKSYLEILMRNKLYMSAAYVLIAVGAITIILSVIGCLGSFTVRTQWGQIIYKLHLKR